MYTRLSLIVSSMLSSCYYYLEAKGRAANYFLFGKSYDDSINNENNSRLITVVDIHFMLRNINCRIRLSLHLI